MTRLVALFAAMVFCAPLSAADREVPKELLPFQGEWVVVKVDFDGKVLSNPSVRFTFTGDKLTTTEGGNPSDAGTVTLNTKPDPPEIEIALEKGMKIQALYRFAPVDRSAFLALPREGQGKVGGGSGPTPDRLELCLSLTDSAARPKAFDGKGSVVFVLERVKK